MFTLYVTMVSALGSMKLYLLPPSPPTFSVTIMSTTPRPVRGREQVSSILFPPDLAECSMVTITLAPGDATRSMAPPMPFTILPYGMRREGGASRLG